MLSFTHADFPSYHADNENQVIAAAPQEKMLLQLQICCPKFTNMENHNII